jgi:hypothetical protein
MFGVLSQGSSNDVSEVGDIQPQDISMSTTFYPRDDNPHDLMIVTCDGIFFAVQKSILLAKSKNWFGGLLVEADCMSFVGQLVILIYFDGLNLSSHF